jgi:F-type H+-transporting ATPase subunit epsilon
VNLFNIEILTPERKVFEAKISSAMIPADDGWVEILFNHCDFVGGLGQGILRLETEAGTEKFAISEGLFNVLNGNLNILTDNVTTASDLTPELVKLKIEALNKELAKLKEAGVSNVSIEMKFIKGELRYTQAQLELVEGKK